MRKYIRGNIISTPEDVYSGKNETTRAYFAFCIWFAYLQLSSKKVSASSPLRNQFKRWFFIDPRRILSKN